MQGLQSDYLSSNDLHVRASKEQTPPQSIEDIDRILLEAGLQLPPPRQGSANPRQGSIGTPSNGSSASTEVVSPVPEAQQHGNGAKCGEDMEW
jgi:hypothetical protein